MAKPKRSSVQQYHDRVAARYDNSYRDAFWMWHNSLTWDYIKPSLPRDQSLEVIDLGCGTAVWASRLVKSGYRVTCVDISGHMLDRARIKIENQGGGDKASYLQADLMDLSELPKHKFALALAMGDPLGCTDSPIKAMKQVRRILRPDGVLIATFDNRLGAIEHYLAGKSREELVSFLKHGKTHWLTNNKSEQFEIHTYGPAELTKLVETSGFQVLDMVGKTVLPMRHYRNLLETPRDRRDWALVEKKLCRRSDALGRASHLQVVCRPLPE